MASSVIELDNMFPTLKQLNSSFVAIDNGRLQFSNFWRRNPEMLKIPFSLGVRQMGFIDQTSQGKKSRDKITVHVW